ncbi:MBL fold metallo-hydrolase [Methanobacterium sp. ACI-7]|uniref:MBL fold metallo-hydrolase n=1 Tax=unclassified Methanobacterium TaxID=2627676 RepID=UPI0039C4D626
MEIIVLLENTKEKGSNFCIEHGMSLLLEINDKKILFDSGGPENSAIINASKLGINLETIDIAVISHGHGDHTGGLKEFIKINSKAPVLLKKEVFNQYYSLLPQGYKNIGTSREILEKYPKRFKFIEKTVKIAPNIFLVPNITKTFPIPTSNNVLFTNTNNEMIKDTFEHELFMVVEKGKDLVIFSGCGHNGIKNIVNTAIQLFSQKTVGTVIGGFHLQAGSSDYAIASKNEILEIAEWLKSSVKGEIYTGHCTGKQGIDLMKIILQSRIKSLYTGLKIKL